MGKYLAFSFILLLSLQAWADAPLKDWLFARSGVKVTTATAGAPFSSDTLLLEIKGANGKSILRAHYRNDPKYGESLGNLHCGNCENAADILAEALKSTAPQGTGKAELKILFEQSLKSGAVVSVYASKTSELLFAEGSSPNLNEAFAPRKMHVALQFPEAGNKSIPLFSSLESRKEMQTQAWDSAQSISVPTYDVLVDSQKSDFQILEGHTPALRAQTGFYISNDISHGLWVKLAPKEKVPTLKMWGEGKKILIDAPEPEDKRFMDFSVHFLKALRPDAESFVTKFENTKKDLEPITAPLPERDCSDLLAH